MRKHFYIGCITVVLAGCEPATEQTTAVAESPPAESSGFVHYDRLPLSLKDTMQLLVDTYPDRHFNFYYYFDVDDINRHYYLEDAGLAVVAEQPVTDQRILQFIEDRLYDTEVRARGSYIAMDTTAWNAARKMLKKHYRNHVHYVLPKSSADFQRLRVALVEDTARASSEHTPDHADTKVYSPDQVDLPARPVRGIEYFRNAVQQEVQLANNLILQDSGTITIEFSVWSRQAQSPKLVRGFSTQSDAYEAYQTDGAFVKAINRAKVRWHHALKDGRPVRSKVRVAFDVRQLKSLPTTL